MEPITCVPTDLYTIKYGKHEIKVNPLQLSIVSKKFKTLYEQNPSFLEISETTEDFRIFFYFISIAQGIQITPHNYWTKRIIKIAEEWEAESVVKMLEKSYKEVDPHDALTALIEADDEESKKAAIKNAALALPELLDDDRLLDELTILDIYQIIDRAEEEGFEADKKLIPFVMKNIKEDPSSMIPLLLRIDFDSLSDEDYSIIFSRPEVHEQNINFFSAASMSSTYQVANTEIKNFEREIRKTAEKRKQLKHTGKEDALVDRIKICRTTDLDRYRAWLASQQETIADLNNALEAEKKELKESINRTHIPKTRDDLLKEAQDELSQIIEGGREKALKIIDDDEAEDAALFNELLKDANDRLNSKMFNVGPVPKDIIDKIDEYTENFTNIKERLDKVNEEITDVHSFMLAKIIHDKLKQDEFLRNTERRFEVIEDEEERKKVEEAEAKIRQLENDLEEKCPITKRKKASNT